MPQTYVLYHDHCPDGFGAAWAFPRDPGMPGVRTSHHIPPTIIRRPHAWMEPGSRLFILDFSYPRETILELQRTHESVILLDHHKTAAEELQGVPHCHIDQSHSGAYLAWQYANPSEKPPGLILYVQDRDLWEWKLPNSREVSEAIASYPNTFAAWDSFDVGAPGPRGHGDSQVHEGQVNKLVSMASRQTVGGRPNIPVVNTSLMVSEACEALLKKFPDAPFAAAYSQTGGETRWSLRSRNTEDTDVSQIAKEFRGGGHKNAAGFVEKT